MAPAYWRLPKLMAACRAALKSWVEQRKEQQDVVMHYQASAHATASALAQHSITSQRERLSL